MDYQSVTVGVDCKPQSKYGILVSDSTLWHLELKGNIV